MKTFILLSFALLGFSRAMIVANPISSSADRFCGQSLNHAMKYFCTPEMKRTIIQTSYSKRSSSILNQLWTPYSDDFDYNTHYDSDQGSDLMYGNYIIRKRASSVTQECCKQPCTLRTLIEFCPS